MEGHGKSWKVMEGTRTVEHSIAFSCVKVYNNLTPFSKEREPPPYPLYHLGKDHFISTSDLLYSYIYPLLHTSPYLLPSPICDSNHTLLQTPPLSERLSSRTAQPQCTCDLWTNIRLCSLKAGILRLDPFRQRVLYLRQVFDWATGSQPQSSSVLRPIIRIPDLWFSKLSIQFPFKTSFPTYQQSYTTYRQSLPTYQPSYRHIDIATVTIST